MKCKKKKNRELVRQLATTVRMSELAARACAFGLDSLTCEKAARKALGMAERHARTSWRNGRGRSRSAAKRRELRAVVREVLS